MKTRPNTYPFIQVTREVKMLLTALFFLCTQLMGATLVVSNNSDSGPGSLRDAVSTAVSGDTIAFSQDTTIGLLSKISTGSKDLIFDANGFEVIIDGTSVSDRFLSLWGDFTLTFNGIVFRNFFINDDHGAVMYLNKGSLILENCTFHDNSSIDTDNSNNHNGGAITIGGGATSVTITSCHFYNNSSPNNGGAVNIEAIDSLSITNSTFTNNSCNNSGGAIRLNIDSAATAILSQNTFTANNATVNGGALMIAGNGTYNIYNSTLHMNLANSGTEIYAFGDAIVNIYSTIAIGSDTTNNIRAHHAYTSGSFNMDYCLYDSNRVANITSITNSVDTSATSFSMNALDNNGGLNPTLAIDNTSPAYNAGSNPQSFINDQRGIGFNRIAEGLVDIGAYEYSPVIGIAINDFDGDGNADLAGISSDNRLYVITTDGNGVADSFTYLSFDMGDYGLATTGDMDGDSDMDIIIQDDAGRAAVWYYENQAYSDFQWLVNFEITWDIKATVDFNNDGHVDILWQDTNGQILVWYMNAGSYSSMAYLNTTVTTDVLVGAYDFDSNGSADLVMQNATGIDIWYYSGETQSNTASISASAEADVIQVDDYDNDGNADLLLSNDEIIYLSGSSISSRNYLAITLPIAKESGMALEGAGDLDGDGNADLLLTDGSDNLYGWFLNGSMQRIGSENLMSSFTKSVLGVADMDNDGNVDIVRYDSIAKSLDISYLDGSGNETSTSTAITGLGDFIPGAIGNHNAGTVKDIIVSDPVSGASYLWDMNSDGSLNSSSLFASFAGWKVVAGGDANGDGNEDLLWYHSSGALYQWLMDGNGSFTGVNYITNITGWSVKAFTDMDGDNKADIVWKNDSSTEGAIWYMDGAGTISSYEFITE